MKNTLKKILLILLCVYSAFFFIGSTLAPIMAHFQQYYLSSILTSLYMFSCHQQPDRSFWIFGYPIALCCRCYGFYLGVIVSTIIALCDKLKFNKKTFFVLLTICIIDIVINYGLGMRLNTGNLTRFIVGIIMGVLFIKCLCYILCIKWSRKYEN